MASRPQARALPSSCTAHLREQRWLQHTPNPHAQLINTHTTHPRTRAGKPPPLGVPESAVPQRQSSEKRSAPYKAFTGNHGKDSGLNLKGGKSNLIMQQCIVLAKPWAWKLRRDSQHTCVHWHRVKSIQKKKIRQTANYLSPKDSHEGFKQFLQA